MPKRRPTTDLTLEPPAAGAGLLRWLYDEIREAILDGRLLGGSRLPSTRTLADQYQVARGTVVAAFDQLIAEGYLESRVGDGTFVRKTLPSALFETRSGRSRSPAGARLARLSTRGAVLAAHGFPQLWSVRGVETFTMDRPALDVFPLRLWNRLAARNRRKAAPRLLVWGEGLGMRPLREAIAQQVAQERGVRCTADQVVITAGTQASLDLVSRLLLEPGDAVCMEDPGYAGATSLFRAHGMQVAGVRVDEEGIDCAAGRRRCASPRLVYVTPGCQFPLGVTLSLPRRLALLEWARESGAWIFEDDYDSQLRFSGRPLAALKSLDALDCVIYSNSFNKMLYPSLRLAFLIVPPPLVEAVTAARSIIDRFPSVLEQATLCDFIADGHMDQHMRRMRELYETRFDALMSSARRHLPGLMTFSSTGAGLQAVGWLEGDIDENEACQGAAAQGINSVPLSRLTIGQPRPPGLVLGVGSADVPAVRRAVERLGQVLRQVRSRSGGGAKAAAARRVARA